MRKIYYELVDLLLLELKILNKIKKNIKTILSKEKFRNIKIIMKSAPVKRLY